MTVTQEPDGHQDIPVLRRHQALVTEYGAHLEPALVVRAGERFRVETNDAFFNTVVLDGDVPRADVGPVAARQYMRANPLAGPIFVEGVEPGDTLVVDIEEIAVRDWGWTGQVRGLGPLAGLAEFADLEGDFGTILRIEPNGSGARQDEVVSQLGRGARWPMVPFIGTIASAPERGVENSLVTQGPWGGNIDTRDITAGNSIHLNAAHPGALLFLGDVHASQGDGEMCGIANETAATVTLRCNVLKDRIVPGICRIEKSDALIQVDGARNAGGIDRALTSCFVNMLRWLRDDYGMDARECYLRLSADSRVRVNVYQFVNGAFTCGVEFPKDGLTMSHVSPEATSR